MKTGSKVTILPPDDNSSYLETELTGKIISSDANRTRFCVEYSDEGIVTRKWFHEGELKEVEKA